VRRFLSFSHLSKIVEYKLNIIRFERGFFIILFCRACMFQVPRRWNTRPDNGTRSASAAWSARIRSARRALFRASKRFTVPDATRTSSPPDVLSATRWATPFFGINGYFASRLVFVYCMSREKLVNITSESKTESCSKTINLNLINLIYNRFTII